MNLLQQIQAEIVAARQTKPVDIRPGDVVKVHVRIRDAGDRIQMFEGTVIRIHNASAGGTFTVRKVSSGVGVERIFPFASPNVAQVDVLIRHKVRRAKLHFLRNRTGKSARLKPMRDFKASR